MVNIICLTLRIIMKVIHRKLLKILFDQNGLELYKIILDTIWPGQGKHSNARRLNEVPKPLLAARQNGVFINR